MPQSPNYDNESAVVLNDQGQVVTLTKTNSGYQVNDGLNPTATGLGGNRTTVAGDPPGFAKNVLSNF